MEEKAGQWRWQQHSRNRAKNCCSSSHTAYKYCHYTLDWLQYKKGPRPDHYRKTEGGKITFPILSYRQINLFVSLLNKGPFLKISKVITCWNTWYTTILISNSNIGVLLTKRILSRYCCGVLNWKCIYTSLVYSPSDSGKFFGRGFFLVWCPSVLSSRKAFLKVFWLPRKSWNVLRIDFAIRIC